MTTPAPSSAAAAGAADARIHDIGYRRYEGTRLGRGYARRSLFVHSLRGCYGIGRSARSKVLPMGLFAVMVLPAFGMVVVLAAAGGDLPVDYREYPLFMQPVLGLFLALAGPQLVSLDLRYRTTPLYFSRPIERSDYVAAKFAALSTAVFLFTAIPVTVLYAGGLLTELSVTEETDDFALGLAVCAVYAVLHAAISLLTASLTPRRGFGVGAIIGVLTIPYFAVTALQGVADVQGSDAVGWLGLFSPGTLTDGLQSAYLGGVSQFPGQAEVPSAAGPLYVLVIAGITAACYLLLLRRSRRAGL